jgi:hypothetical protein
VHYCVAFLWLIWHQASTRSSSLTKESIHHLETLFHAQKEYPSSKLIGTWAVLLKAQPEDVVAWLEAQRSSTGPDPDQSPTHHLPTPVSTSPEPQLPGTASNANFVKIDPFHSPVVPSLFGKQPHVSSFFSLPRLVVSNFLLSGWRTASEEPYSCHCRCHFKPQSIHC